MIISNSNSFQNSASQEHSKLGFIDIDVTVTEKINYNNLLTDKMVEDGSHISDNIIILPTVIAIEGILTNKPNGRSIYDALEEIVELRNIRELFTIVTSVGSFDDAFFDGAITVNRQASNSDAIVFNTTLKQVASVESEVRFVPAENVKKEGQKVGGDERQRAGTKDSGKVPAKSTRRTDATIDLLGIQS